MYRLMLITVLFSLAFCSSLKAQEKLDYNYVDSSPYQLWLNKDWNNLIKISALASQNNIEFYYLTLRTGVAWYEKKN